jgi:MFS family permease
MDSSSALKTIRLLKQKEFSLYISTRFIVIFSLFMQSTVLSYMMYTITKDPFSLGLIGLAEVIPAFGFAFFAGYLVDKAEKRTVYMLCILFYLLNAILTIYITSTFFQHQVGMKTVEWMIYLVMFVSGCIRAFLAPASFSLLPLLVARADISQAVTWSSTSWMLGSVLGPLAGGLLMASIGVHYTIIIAACCMGIASLSILFVKRKPVAYTKDIGLIKGLSQGFRFVFRSEIILAVLSLDLFAVLFGGAEALLPVFSKEILEVGEVGYGWLRSAHGIGSICLLFLLAYLPLKTNIGYKLFASVAGFGLCILLFGISGNVYLSFGLLFFGGMFDGVSVVIRHSILQLKTPEELKGRVSSINMMFISSSNELGAFESGLAARMLGTVPSVVFGGIMTILVVLVTYFAAPNLKKIKLD